MIPQATIDAFEGFDEIMNLTRSHIYHNHHNNPFTCSYLILDILRNHHNGANAIESYNPQCFQAVESEVDFSYLSLEDVIKGFYDIHFIKSEIKKSYMQNKSKPLHIKIQEIYDQPKWQGKLFKAMRPHITFTQVPIFYEFITFIQTSISETLLDRYGIELPDQDVLEKDLIQLYLQTRKEKSAILPSIEEFIQQLTVNDILYIVNFAHGGVNVKNPRTGELYKKPETVLIPDTMDFYRIMASEYGAVAATARREVDEFISKIKNFLKIQPKYTHKNNIKYLERVLATLLKKTNEFMNNSKKRGILGATAQNKEMYDATTAHVHYFKEKEVIFKEHSIYLFKDDLIDGVYVVTPQITINLLDYIDIKITNGVIRFNLSDIIKLIQHIKYVLFIDLSCSSSYGTNQEIKDFKALAENTEGPSITRHIEERFNLSPFESRTPDAPKRTHLSLNRARSNRANRSKRSKRFSSLSLTRYKRPELPKLKSKPKTKKSLPHVTQIARVMNI
jgi:hypothetical protein